MYRNWAALTLILVNVLWLGSMSLKSQPVRTSEKLWQHRLSTSGHDIDTRLEKNVDLSYPNITISALLSNLSKQSGCHLTCDPKIAFRPVAVQFSQVRLKTVMAELADFMVSEWWVKNIQGANEYILRQSPSLLENEHSISTEVLSRKRNIKESLDTKYGPLLPRITEYKQAINLPRESLLDKYLQNDPWLCVTSLNQALRPFIEFISGLPERDLDTLASGNRLVFQINHLPPSMQSHIWLCVTARYNGFFPDSGNWNLALDKDSVNRFQTIPERWDHTTLRMFRSEGTGNIFLTIEIPDIAELYCTPIYQKEHNPILAFDKLLIMGIYKPTEEFRRTVKDGEEAWMARQNEKKKKEHQVALVNADRTDPILKLHLIPWRTQEHQIANPTEILLSIGKEAKLSLIADSFFQFDSMRPLNLQTLTENFTRKQSLESALNLWVTSLGGASQWEWSKPIGRFIHVRNVNRMQFWVGQIPMPILTDWDNKVKGKSSITLDELAQLALSLTPEQSYYGIAYTKWFDVFREVGITCNDLSIIAKNNVLHEVLQGKEVPFSKLTFPQQTLLTRYATSNRPWVNKEDLVDARIALIWINTNTKDRAAIVFKYRLPDALSDLDVFARCELSAALPK